MFVPVLCQIYVVLVNVSDLQNQRYDVCYFENIELVILGLLFLSRNISTILDNVPICIYPNCTLYVSGVYKFRDLDPYVPVMQKFEMCIDNWCLQSFSEHGEAVYMHDDSIKSRLKCRAGCQLTACTLWYLLIAHRRFRLEKSKK